MNKYKCLKQKFNNKFECKRTGKEIKISECKDCPFKEYKTRDYTKSLKSNSNQMKNKSSKLAKLERNRFSLFTDDLEHCIICGKSPVNKHEIFYGSGNRQKSMKYGLVIPLCTCEHHNQIECKGIHFDTELQDEWRKKGQALFEETYPDLDFIQIFGRDYL